MTTHTARDRRGPLSVVTPVPGAERRRVLIGSLVAAVVSVVGVAAYSTSAEHQLHDPRHALQQLDMLYLDEPAPGAGQLGVGPGQPAVVVFCPTEPCPLPTVSGAKVIDSDDRPLAARYGLRAGRRTGYALVDAHGHVRYRTYDPHPDRHAPEVQVLVDAVRP